MKANGEEEFTSFKIFVDHVFTTIKDQEWVRRLRPLPPNPKGPVAREYCAFHDGVPLKQLQEQVNWVYLKEFILDTGQPSEARVQREAP